MTRLVVDVTAPGRAPNEVVVATDGRAMAGWQDTAVTLRAEGFPNSFSVGLSSRASGGRSAIVADAGAPCEIYLGDDLVITGYVDRYGEGGDKNSHALSLVGRGKTQDLVDCSAKWPGDQLVQGNALEIATRLAQPYGIEVVLANGADAGAQVPSTALNYTETAADIIQRVARNAGLLAYEDSRGRLVLAAVGSTMAASAIVYGDNVEAWSCETAMDQRYSEIVCCSQSLAAFSDLSGSDFFDTEPDANVSRFRNLNIVLEGVADDPQAFTIKKAKWEVARRGGRGYQVRVTVDSWRDRGGALWLPNTLVQVDVPGFMLADKTLCISEATFRRNRKSGTTAELLLMPKPAFVPEPISLLPLNGAEIPAFAS